MLRRAGYTLPGLFILLGAGAAAAGPPPPTRVPDGLSQPIAGYDLQDVFQVWRYWVEAQKEKAIEALLAEPETIEGERPFGQPFLEFHKHGDFGRFLSGEIRVWCRPAQPYGFVPGTCHYRLRRAYVAHDAATFDGENPVSRWTWKSFDAPKLAAHLRASGFAPDTDWWGADRAKMFAALPPALPILVENGTIVRLDSRDCAAMAAAIENVEQRRFDARFDFIAVGEDQPFSATAAHSIQVTYTLRTIASGRRVTIEGSGRSLDSIVAPVLDAADACERAGAKRSAPASSNLLP